MIEPDVPYDRLEFFQEKLGLDRAEIELLGPYRKLFLQGRDDFAEYVHRFLCSVPETRRIVEVMEARGGLRKNWRSWYERLFTEGFAPQFYQFLWNSGLKHVRRNVDQRYIHLGYCLARTYLGEIVDREVQGEEGRRVRAVVDKMLDQCLLVATDAFLAGTTQCDREVVNGIAHQVRNPLTVIGGFVRNLQKKTPSDSPVQSILDTMFQETRRLEAMVENVAAFTDIMQSEPVFSPCSLDAVLETTVRRVQDEGWATKIELRLGAAVGQPVDSDRRMLEQMFYQLVRNSLEAVQGESTPVIRVTARAEGSPPAAISVEIFNNGRVPGEEELPHLFTPFYSSKPLGSGFGLPIAELVARKAHGGIEIEPVVGEGVYTTVSLPISPV